MTTTKCQILTLNSRNSGVLNILMLRQANIPSLRVTMNSFWESSWSGSLIDNVNSLHVHWGNFVSNSVVVFEMMEYIYTFLDTWFQGDTCEERKDSLKSSYRLG